MEKEAASLPGNYKKGIIPDSERLLDNKKHYSKRTKEESTNQITTASSFPNKHFDTC